MRTRLRGFWRSLYQGNNINTGLNQPWIYGTRVDGNNVREKKSSLKIVLEILIGFIIIGFFYCNTVSVIAVYDCRKQACIFGNLVLTIPQS